MKTWLGLNEETKYYAGDGKNNEGKINVIRSRLCDRAYVICNDCIVLA